MGTLSGCRNLPQICPLDGWTAGNRLPAIDNIEPLSEDPVLSGGALGMKKPSILIIILTVFLDLVGFGIVLPLLPIYSEQYGASGFMIGMIMASYSIMQFIFSPIWGRWSDQIGRRPILLVSLLGSTVSYIIFAIGAGLGGQTALIVLLVSRIFAGICGANITVAQAYIADISAPEERSKRMGLVGMAFGLGFVFGPAIGGLSARYGESVPGWVAAAFCGANFILAVFILTESHTRSTDPKVERQHWEQWKHCLRLPRVSTLIQVFFISTFCFTCFEITLGLLIIDNLKLSGHEAKLYAGVLFAYCGIIGAVIQGGLIGRLVKMLGESKLIVVSLFIFAVSLMMLPFAKSLGSLMVGLTLLTLGTSAIRPPLFGLMSILTSREEQGSTLGVAQGAGSLARCIGPVFAAVLFKESHPVLLYLICAGLACLAGGLALAKLRNPPVPSVSAKGVS